MINNVFVECKMKGSKSDVDVNGQFRIVIFSCRWSRES